MIVFESFKLPLLVPVAHGYEGEILASKLPSKVHVFSDAGKRIVTDPADRAARRAASASVVVVDIKDAPVAARKGETRRERRRARRRPPTIDDDGQTGRRNPGPI
jgi:hypothetical protein